MSTEQIDIDRLIAIIRTYQVKDVKLFIAETSPGEKPEVIHEATLNDVIFTPRTGVLELWHNKGYEI